MTRPQDTPPIDKTLTDVASRIQQLNQRAVAEYTPIVEDIICSNSRDIARIERTLDGLLDFCGDDKVLLLYRRLCHHYWQIDPVSAAQYVHYYREAWDSESLPGWRNAHD